MIKSSTKPRQPRRRAWPLDRLIHERSIALGSSLDKSTFGSYSSALNSYITFCKLHKRPIEPTADTMSFYVVYMSHHIKPDSVDTYLSGICNQLELHFPNVRSIRSSHMVSRTLKDANVSMAPKYVANFPLVLTISAELSRPLGIPLPTTTNSSFANS
jgi:hypothetical protein